MDDKEALIIVEKIFKSVFDKSNPFGLNQILEKFAFDVKLPKRVMDSTTNEVTWADSINSGKFITLANMQKRDKLDGWILPKKPIHNLQEVMDIWKTTNLTTTERVFDSINVTRSDTIYGSENVYRCSDCHKSKNIVYCDGCGSCEYLLASQRSANCTFCIRTDDSRDCSNSYDVRYSNKVANSFFIQDCFNVSDCMFCSHIANKRFCIANMQYTEAEFYAIRKVIINWILKTN